MPPGRIHAPIAVREMGTPTTYVVLDQAPRAVADQFGISDVQRHRLL
ncbi:hypothetical protein NSERUTF1_3950 [Nocardia seriolae]|nr:hypothetical protein NSERUTF1_3950 [Nocardia seriolae]